MTPPDAPDAPRDLLAMLEEIASEEAEDNGEELWHCAAWGDFHRKDLRELVQRVRTAEAEQVRLSVTLTQRARDAEAETGRLREALEHIVANEQCEVAKTGVSPIKTCLDHHIVVPCPYCIAKQALGASRPGEPR